jgi:hypothetical protein
VSPTSTCPSPGHQTLSTPCRGGSWRCCGAGGGRPGGSSSDPEDAPHCPADPLQCCSVKLHEQSPTSM